MCSESQAASLLAESLGCVEVSVALVWVSFRRLRE
jgi:hypothetical protein